MTMMGLNLTGEEKRKTEACGRERSVPDKRLGMKTRPKADEEDNDEDEDIINMHNKKMF